ncbi:DUF58 domain-containing protein [Trichlorobacter lovleyi]|uniref:DUF58 domain-containing protein n=1 Tax=Trichlorobacter lovleyi TaxID=313985 RepID=UPI00223EFB67|nr:DUF58 domain-containing protein [Trichlorobacter lovleyi]QOX80534.1 DUF58 domain-containing protein [Trichlorobacter lovleyi]
MIIPAPAILRLVAATLIPAALLYALTPQFRPLLLFVPPLVGSVALADLLALLLRRNRLTVTAPVRLSLICGRPGQLALAIRAGNRAGYTLQVGLTLPAGFASPFRETRLNLAKGGDAICLDWPLTGSQRGRFQVTACALRIASPFRLWQLQVRHGINTELRVYPNLRAERRRLAALFLERNDRQLRAQRQRGQGREFDRLRQYQTGDSLGDIHWKATAKRNQLITKEYQIERTQEVYLLIDSSRLSGRPVPNAEGGSEPFLEQAVRTALILGSVAQRQGDLFGVAAFGSRVQGFVRAKTGKTHFGHCRDLLYTLQPGQDSPSFGELATFMAARLRRRALLIFIAPLDEPALAEDFVRAIRILSRRHLICVAMPQPPMAAPLFSTAELRSSADLYRQLAGHLTWHQLRELQQSLRLQGVRLLLVKDERLSADLVSNYLDVKRRQLL